MRALTPIALLLALTAPAPAALADEAPRLLRLLGQAPSASGAAPRRFVIDAVIEDGYEPLSVSVDEGWLAALDPGDEPRVQGELEGSCVDGRCAFSVDSGEGKLLLTGDLLGGAASGKFILQDRDERTVAQGPVTFAPFTDIIPGLGRLAAPAAITGAQLSELLLWVGYPSGFFSIDDDPPGDFQRDALALWQDAGGRRGAGLILEDDLAALRAEAAKARAAAGWSEVGPVKMGYPSAWLRSLSASAHPGERRFASDDGKVALVIAADPPLSGDAWDAFVDQQTSGDAPGESNGYTRVNDDMEIARTLDGGVVSAAAYKRTDKAFYRMVLTYPDTQEERWGPIAAILQYELRKAGAEAER